LILHFANWPGSGRANFYLASRVPHAEIVRLASAQLPLRSRLVSLSCPNCVASRRKAFSADAKSTETTANDLKFVRPQIPF
jgi:hypothetical protein